MSEITKPAPISPSFRIQHPGDPCLNNAHREELERSGLSREQIEACGFDTIVGIPALNKLLNWESGTNKLGPCLAIPYRRPDGTAIPMEEYVRLKPTTPRINSETGKPIKYEAPKGSTVRLYFPPATCTKLSDTSIDLLITEGEKKAAKADQEGFACIGLSGVQAWSKKREAGPDGKKVGKRELIDDFDAVALSGRKVFIVFDSDIVTNLNVQKAQIALSKALASRGADVRSVSLPSKQSEDGQSEQKVGLDDYLLEHTAEELQTLLDIASHLMSPDEVGPPALIESHDDPCRLARVFLSEYGVAPCGESSLYWWRDQFYLWKDYVYSPLPESEVRSTIFASVKDEFNRIYYEQQEEKGDDDKSEVCPPQKVTNGLVSNVMSAVKSMRLISGAVHQPDWLTEVSPFSPEDVISTRSGLVHLPNLVEGLPSFIAPTPTFFSTNAVDYEFNSEASCESWHRFTQSLWPNDPKSIECLQEWFGYLLLPDIQQHKILILIGPPRSGKGVIAQILKRVIGERNVASPTLASLAEPFGLWPLLGKTVALIPEARVGARSDTIATVERLLSISGADPQDIQRKNLPTLTGVRLPVRFVLMTNELPDLRDSSGAFANRFIVIPTSISWLGREDKSLVSRLESELPGILNWSIEGWQRLKSRGHFNQPDSGAELLSELRNVTSPVSQFISDCCVVGPQYSVPVKSVYGVWKDWCREHGREHPGTQQSLGRDLRSSLPGISVRQPTIGQSRERVYSGLGLRSARDCTRDS